MCIRDSQMEQSFGHGNASCMDRKCLPQLTYLHNYYQIPDRRQNKPSRRRACCRHPTRLCAPSSVLLAEPFCNDVVSCTVRIGCRTRFLAAFSCTWRKSACVGTVRWSHPGVPLLVLLQEGFLAVSTQWSLACSAHAVMCVVVRVLVEIC